MRKLALTTIGAIAAIAAVSSPWGEDDPTPRADRHGTKHRPEPTQYTRSKDKSASLQKLLRK